jgi:hypothetical protein
VCAQDNPATATQHQAMQSVQEDEWYRTKPVATAIVDDGTLRTFAMFHALAYAPFSISP